MRRCERAGVTWFRGLGGWYAHTPGHQWRATQETRGPHRGHWFLCDLARPGSQLWSSGPSLLALSREITGEIRSLADLMHYLGAESVQGMNRRLYKDTRCGASLSVQTPDGKWHHNGQDWRTVREIQAFTMQTIIEGSDATVESEPFVLPVPIHAVNLWIKTMEAEARILWREANRTPRKPRKEATP